VTSDGLHNSADGKPRCWWCGDDPDYIRYHDTEWGRPVHDDRTLFEKLTLEGFQAGLSWITILRKRENFRQSFDNFAIDKVAAYDESDILRLLQNSGIIRHRGKITAAINNARRAQELQQEYGSLSAFIWRYKPENHTPPTTYEEAKARTQSTESQALARALKKRGWQFVGPTTLYAFMQAMGLMDDHLHGCHIHNKKV
jgi:DNA-3-methyladenine glycosylase I